MTDKIQRKLENFKQLILDEWKEQNLTLTDLSKQQISYLWEQKRYRGFPEQLIKNINDAIAQNRVIKTKPYWLSDIDNFFSQKAFYNRMDLSYSNIMQNEYLILIALSLPLVSLDKIIKLESFDDDMLRRHELSFLQFSVPRDLDEAKLCYETLLNLPKKTVLHSVMGIHSSSQPFKAQMWMVQLLQNHNNTELYNYQKELLHSAPKFLFEYPDSKVTDIALSNRPAFWMSFSVPTEFNEIIEQKSTDIFKKYFDERKSFNAKKEKFKNIIATTMPEDTRPITKRVSKGEMEFAKLLESFDNLLSEYNITLPLPLNDEQIEKLQAYLAPYRLPDEYITLYKWHNGCSLADNVIIYDSIEDNLLTYDMFKQEKEYFEDWWHKNLFPLKEFNGDTFWLLNLNNTHSSKVDSIFLEDAELKSEYRALKQMIEIYKKAIEEKIIYFAPISEEWHVDEEAFSKLKGTYY